jgi:hypothetical protein
MFKNYPYFNFLIFWCKEYCHCTIYFYSRQHSNLYITYSLVTTDQARNISDSTNSLHNLHVHSFITYDADIFYHHQYHYQFQGWHSYSSFQIIQGLIHHIKGIFDSSSHECVTPAGIINQSAKVHLTIWMWLLPHFCSSSDNIRRGTCECYIPCIKRYIYIYETILQLFSEAIYSTQWYWKQVHFQLISRNITRPLLSIKNFITLILQLHILHANRKWQPMYKHKLLSRKEKLQSNLKSNKYFQIWTYICM